MITIIAALLVLLYLSGVFSSMETSLATLNKAKIKSLFNSRKLNIFRDWLTSPSSVYSTILVGNNLVNIAFSSIMSFVVIKFALARGASETVSAAAALLITSLFLLFFGEIMPKNIATTYPRRVSEFSGGLLNLFRKLLMPFTGIITYFSDRIVGYNSQPPDLKINRKDIGELTETLKEKGRSSETITKILALRQKKVFQIMTPRKVITGIDLKAEKSRIMEIITDSGISRFPAYYGSLSNLAGIIYTRDIVNGAISGGSSDLRSYVHRPFFIASDETALAAYRKMVRNRVHIAVVAVEGKSIEGIVTMEDLLEEIFGSILDEYDLIRPSSDGESPEK